MESAFWHHLGVNRDGLAAMSPIEIDKYLIVMNQKAKYEEAMAELARQRASREAAGARR